MSKIRNFLQKPFPGPDRLISEVKGLFIAAVIVFLFLFAFRPFGIGSYPHSIFVLTLGFGAVSFFSSLTYMLTTRYVIGVHKDVDSWTMKHWIIDLLLMICVITLGNYLFSLYFFNMNFSWVGMAYMLMSTILVAIFPVLIFGLQKQIKQEKENTQNAHDISEELAHHEISATKTNTVLVIESMQNYINVYSTDGKKTEKETIRMTLTSALSEYSDQRLIRCHRSYLVNTDQVHNVTGNAQGLKLEMIQQRCPIIPVSRSYISDIKNALK